MSQRITDLENKVIDLEKKFEALKKQRSDRRLMNIIESFKKKTWDIEGRLNQHDELLKPLG